MNMRKQKKRDKDRLVANQENASTWERVKANHERKIANREHMRELQK